ncbi:sensor histidine kinase [Paenibacillus alkalitolerans]|uniref:sensor histidine kinase n=1 Tax=Paenibacillus alkalitolerans TaxID=2799335 RepID=UPI0018F44A8A|nr:histidine kinase [Paenibacillus alkalitolerans]
MRISTKMIVGYMLLIVLPFLLFAVFIYYQLYDKLLTEYQLSNQQNLEQLAGNLGSGLGKIESLHSIYQNNVALRDFLRGEYTADRDLIYTYLKEISPAFSFAHLADPSIRSLTVYPKSQTRLLSLPGFQPFDKIHEKLEQAEIESLRPARGLWKRTAVNGNDLSLAYYHKIYSETFTSDLGIIEMNVSPALIGGFLRNLREVHPGNVILLMDKDGRISRHGTGLHISDVQASAIASLIRDNGKKSFVTGKDRWLVNSVNIPRLGLTVIEVNKQNTLFIYLTSKLLWVAGGIGVLALLSILYYWIVSSMTKRIVLLSRHMRRVGADSLSSFTGKSGSDEIGFLIDSYNAMIARIDELVNRVQKVELLKKEADFKMLQAQIQPHFLYNTLETMRMLARSNRDYKVADMAYSLGNLLRYSLSKNDDTTLEEELENVRAYIAIHQIRMQDLAFELDVEDGILPLRCPRFILQPLVENSLIHGLSRKRGAKTIAIRIQRENDRAIVEVSDNGAGIAAEKLDRLQRILNGSILDGAIEKQSAGIGLSNVAERIKAYFGQNSELRIASPSGEGTVCSLLLELKENGHAQTDDRG